MVVAAANRRLRLWPDLPLMPLQCSIGSRQHDAPATARVAGAWRVPAEGGCGTASTDEPVRCGYRNELISIVSSRPGPTPIAEIGAPDISSSAFTYAWAFFGRSAKVFALEMSSLQPGSIS